MNELRKIAKKLRLATALVKIAPFVCAIFYVVSLIVYIFGSNMALFVVDSLFYVSPIAVVFIYALGVIFECCQWHRLQCGVLFIPTMTSFLDVMLDFTPVATWVNWATMIIVISGSLYNAYRMFWQDGKADE